MVPDYKRPFHNVESFVPANGLALIINRKGIIQDMIVGDQYEMMSRPNDILNKHVKVFSKKSRLVKLSKAIKKIFDTGKPVHLGKTTVYWGNETRCYHSWLSRYDKYRCAIVGVLIKKPRQLAIPSNETDKKVG